MVSASAIVCSVSHTIVWLILDLGDSPRLRLGLLVERLIEAAGRRQDLSANGDDHPALGVRQLIELARNLKRLAVWVRAGELAHPTQAECWKHLGQCCERLVARAFPAEEAPHGLEGDVRLAGDLFDRQASVDGPRLDVLPQLVLDALTWLVQSSGPPRSPDCRVRPRLPTHVSRIVS